MEIIELTKHLVSVPSQIGNTTEIEELIARYLDRIPGTETEIQPVPGHGNNVMSKTSEKREGPTILVNGHLDTVEVCRGWTRDPFKPEVRDDRLYGLGSADMKAGVAVGLKTFEMLACLDDVNAIFAGTIDEEGDSTGAFTLLDSGARADLCLIPEPSSNDLMMGCRGRLVFRIDVKGISSHGAKPDEGVNAISEASKFICGLKEIELMEHPELPRGSYCVLSIDGGTGTLSVPDLCRIKLDRHYVEGETASDIVQQLKQAAMETRSNAAFDIGLHPERCTPFLEPFITEPKGLAQEFIDVVGGNISYGKSVGDYNAFARHMPTLVYGPHGENWHSADEWVSVSSVNKALEGYERFVEHISGKDF